LGKKLNLELYYVEDLTYPVTFVLTTALSRICCAYRNRLGFLSQQFSFLSLHSLHCITL